MLLLLEKLLMLQVTSAVWKSNGVAGAGSATVGAGMPPGKPSVTRRLERAWRCMRNLLAMGELTTIGDAVVVVCVECVAVEVKGPTPM